MVLLYIFDIGIRIISDYSKTVDRSKSCQKKVYLSAGFCISSDLVLPVYVISLVTGFMTS